jgi:hypothetical protein
VYISFKILPFYCCRPFAYSLQWWVLSVISGYFGDYDTIMIAAALLWVVLVCVRERERERERERDRVCVFVVRQRNSERR